MKNLFTNKRLYIYISIIAAVFLLSYWFDILYNLAWIMTVVLVVLIFTDALLLFRNKNGIEGKRHLPQKLSNSDENHIFFEVKSNYPVKVSCMMIEELPEQFQKRDFNIRFHLTPGQKYSSHYSLRPVERGEYHFGQMRIFVSSPLGLLSKRYSFCPKDTVTKVYPSFIQMRKYSFLALNDRLHEYGLKKIRRLGHTMEFEQIKRYVAGDDIRTINWKSTAKHGKLMVNQYQDEKSQPIYSVIDTGRVMKMPFEGLTLLDYAINSVLAFSNIAIMKDDKAGLLDFNKKVNTFLPASKTSAQMLKINESLYNIKTDFWDSDFSYLYAYIKRKITQRSLIMLYTNFEHIPALKRQLRYIKGIARKHPVIVIVFENTELQLLIDKKAKTLQDIYHKTIAEKFAYDKKLIIKELQRHGIYTILTKPQNLTVNVINKYFELKARGRI